MGQRIRRLVAGGVGTIALVGIVPAASAEQTDRGQIPLTCRVDYTDEAQITPLTVDSGLKFKHSSRGPADAACSSGGGPAESLSLNLRSRGVVRLLPYVEQDNLYRLRGSQQVSFTYQTITWTFKGQLSGGALCDNENVCEVRGAIQGRTPGGQAIIAILIGLFTLDGSGAPTGFFTVTFEDILVSSQT